jgi:hypothetical protein
MTDLIWDTQVKRRGEDSGRFFFWSGISRPKGDNESAWLMRRN